MVTFETHTHVKVFSFDTSVRTSYFCHKQEAYALNLMIYSLLFSSVMSILLRNATGLASRSYSRSPSLFGRISRSGLVPALVPLSHSSSGRMFMSSEADGEDTVVSRCTRKIQDALQPENLSVTAMHDDPNGSHISINIVSSKFEGKKSVMRQRLVYQAIWDEMADGGAVHAVDQIIAKTPEEAA